MVKKSQKIVSPTLADQVANRLRFLLLSGEIKGDQRLRIRHLQEQFGVSHIPIREALRRLTSEGLVEYQPRRGAVAARVDLDLLSDLYDARRLLEPPLAARAVRLFTEKDLQELDSSFRRLEAASKTMGEEFYAVHREFHWYVLKPACSQLLKRILEQLWDTSERFVRLTRGEFSSDAEVAIHRDIYEMCMAADPGIKEAMIEHLQLTENALRKRLYQRTVLSSNKEAGETKAVPAAPEAGEPAVPPEA